MTLPGMGQALLHNVLKYFLKHFESASCTISSICCNHDSTSYVTQNFTCNF